MRKTIEQKIAELQRKQRFAELRKDAKDRLLAAKLALQDRDYAAAQELAQGAAETCQSLIGLTIEVAESEQ